MTAPTKGRPATFANRDALIAALAAIRDADAENMPSRHLMSQLVEQGRVVLETAPSEGKRGRPRHVATLTGKARGWLALMERNAAKRALKEQAQA